MIARMLLIKQHHLLFFTTPLSKSTPYIIPKATPNIPNPTPAPKAFGPTVTAAFVLCGSTPPVESVAVIEESTDRADEAPVGFVDLVTEIVLVPLMAVTAAEAGMEVDA
jgi:hypothetical protein